MRELFLIFIMEKLIRCKKCGEFKPASEYKDKYYSPKSCKPCRKQNREKFDKLRKENANWLKVIIG